MSVKYFGWRSRSITSSSLLSYRRERHRFSFSRSPFPARLHEKSGPIFAIAHPREPGAPQGNPHPSTRLTRLGHSPKRNYVAREMKNHAI